MKILLVEDNRDTLRVMVQLLEMSGHHVQAAQSVQEAVAAAATGTFDLLLRNGPELTPRNGV